MDEVNQYILCPNCGANHIEAEGYVTLQLFSDNGSLCIAEMSKAGWTGDSEVFCNECGWVGIVSDAVVAETPKGCLAVNKGVNQNEPLSIGRREELS